MKHIQAFNEALSLWFSTNQRHFPWRETRDPYLVWVSEIMSQQTQITRVAKDFYPPFIKAFPSIQDLAKVEWEAVYPIWDGLGYYRRGQNMLKCAKVIVERHQGAFPRTVEGLESLPGIGKYTASAIASFAYGEKVPAIDTNISHIIRVLWEGQDTVKIAQALVDDYAGTSGEWNSAMMDLASFLKSGKIIEGTLATFFPTEVAKEFIPKRKKNQEPKNQRTKIPHTQPNDIHRIEVGIACIHQDGKYLIQTRPKGKSFVGFWEFPGGKREKGEDFRTCVKREIKEEIGIQVSVRPHFCETIHEFENKVLVLRFHRCQIQSGEPQALEHQKLKWAAPSAFGKIKFLPTNRECLEHLKKMRV
ncbi:MAG TPA: NUDIX domain-containing protein, partial [Candidatus Gracilibacteria bacterium]